jgi:hypothetical protein
MLTRVIDEQASHYLCGNTKEVSSILPIDSRLIDKRKYASCTRAVAAECDQDVHGEGNSLQALSSS